MTPTHLVPHTPSPPVGEGKGEGARTCSRDSPLARNTNHDRCALLTSILLGISMLLIVRHTPSPLVGEGRGEGARTRSRDPPVVCNTNHDLCALRTSVPPSVFLC